MAQASEGPPIPGYRGYFAFPDGGIWSSRSEQFLAPQRSGGPRRYRHVTVTDASGKQRARLVHRLCMSAVHGRALARHEVVEHINHQCTDNRWANLNVTTQKANIARGHADGRQVKGSRVAQAKLNEEQVAEIKRDYALGSTSHRRLARTYGVSKSTITFILSGVWWRHVSPPAIST